MKRAFYETEAMFLKRQLRHVVQERDALKESVLIAVCEILKLQEYSTHDKNKREGLITGLINEGKYKIKRRNYKK